MTLPTLSLEVSSQPPGPLATRPFGLDSLTRMTAVSQASPVVSVHPDTQLSVLNGHPLQDRADGTNCNTESDGQDQIAVDIDYSDD